MSWPDIHNDPGHFLIWATYGSVPPDGFMACNWFTVQTQAHIERVFGQAWSDFLSDEWYTREGNPGFGTDGHARFLFDKRCELTDVDPHSDPMFFRKRVR